jgi:hypothetical protein
MEDARQPIQELFFLAGTVGCLAEDAVAGIIGRASALRVAPYQVEMRQRVRRVRNRYAAPAAPIPETAPDAEN